MNYQLLIAFFSVYAITACQVGPSYSPPCVETPDEWKGPHIEEAANVDSDHWWDLFNDPTLDCLERQAEAVNPDLVTLAFRIQEAKANALIVRSDLFPQLGLNPGFTNTGTLFKLFLPPGSPQTLTSVDKFRIHQQVFAFPLNLNYDLDLFGKNQSRYESAFYAEQAQEDAYFAALLNLQTSLAGAYFNLRSLDSSIDLLKRTIALRETDVQLSERRFQQGLVSALDVENYRQILIQSKIDLVDNERLRSLQENQIALFVGVPASIFALPFNPLNASPPPIPAGIPSEVLLKRPDLAQAERTMASQHALINAAYASYFPSFSLTGGIGFISPDFKSFMDNFSRYWNMGVQAKQTVFDGGRIPSNVDISWARFFQASSEYQSLVLKAFKEVEDNLTDLDAEAKQVKNVEALLATTRKASKLSKQRYEGGLTNNFEYVTNERAVLNAELQLSTLQSLQYNSTVNLIRSMGGL
jgi:multidrug efflux system outer membrane protein